MLLSADPKLPETDIEQTPLVLRRMAGRGDAIVIDEFDFRQGVTFSAAPSRQDATAS